MGLFSSTPSPLQELGFKHKAKIIIDGEQGSGKKTLFIRLTDFAAKEDHYPFMNFGVVQIEKVRFQLAGIRNEFNARATWEEDIEGADAIIYLVDASDSASRKNAFQQLKKVIELLSNKKTTILVLGNKIDKQGAVTEAQLREQLKLEHFQSKNRIKLVMCSLRTKANLASGLSWVADSLR